MVVEDAAGTWATELPGAAVAERDGNRVVLELTQDADEQVILDRARAAGRVTHFSRVEPTLLDLFRSVVSA